MSKKYINLKLLREKSRGFFYSQKRGGVFLEARVYLEKSHKADLQIRSKIEELEHLREMVCKISSFIREDKVQSTPEKSPMENAIMNIMLVEEDLNELVVNFLNLKKEISKIILKVKKNEHRFLLELRYLCFMGWEEIAEKMECSLSYVYRQHNKALKDVQKILNQSEVITFD